MSDLRVKNWDRWQSYRKDRGQPPWIKIHRCVMRNPEWVSLTDAQRGQLVAIWLLAADRDGAIPASAQVIQKLCFMDSEPNLKLFMEKGFIEGDANVTPARRQADANMTNQSRVEEIREEKKVSCAVADATRTEEEFERFWESYPKRGTAANPKKPAREKFGKLMGRGSDPSEIIAGARRYCELERAAGRDGSDKIAQAITWLNQERWKDYQAPARTDTEPIWKKPPPGQLSLEEIRAKYGVPHAEGHRSQVRSDARLGQNGADHSEKLQLPGGSPLRDEGGGAEGRAPDD